MNRLLLKLTAVMLIFAGIASSCNPELEREYPKDISFTEYSLDGTSCQWINLNYNDELIIINSDEELQNYISCSNDTYSEINRHTLLLASGNTPNGIIEINKHLLQISANKYQLEFEILLDETEMEGLWITALVVSKLSKESDIELITILKH